MSVIRGLIKGGAWLTLASVVSKLAAMLSLPAVARFVGPDALGIYTIVFSLAQTGQGVCGLGTEVVIHRNGAQFETLGRHTVGRLFGVGLSLVVVSSCIAGALIWIFRDFLAHRWLGQSEVAPWLGAAALIIVVQPLGNIPLLFLASLQEFRLYALRSSLGIMLGTFTIVLLAWRFGLTGAVWGLVVAALIQGVISYLIVKPALQSKGIRLRIDNFRSETLAILKLGFPYYYANTLLGSLVALPVLGLVSHYGGLGEVGFLRVSQSLAAVIGFVPAAIAPAAISYLSASLAQDDNSYGRLKLVHFRAVWILLLLLTCPACLLLPSITRLVFGSAYADTYLLSWVALWLALLVGVSSVLVQYLLVTRKTTRIALLSTIGVALFVGSSALLVPKYHALGFLLAQFIGQIVITPFVAYPAMVNLEADDLRLIRNLTGITLLVFVGTLVVPFTVSNPLAVNGLAAMAFVGLSLLVFSTVLKREERAGLWRLLTDISWLPILRNRNSTP